MATTVFNLRNVLFLCSFFALAHSKALPSFIKPCRKNDPHLDQCLINLINGIKPRLAKGIPEMRIPPLEPFFIPIVKLDQGSSSVNFKATFKNVTAYTGINFNLNSVKIDFKEPSIKLDVFLPHVKLLSHYTIDGKVLVVPIKGDGPVKGNFSNINVHLNIKGKYIPKNGKTYMAFGDKEIDFKIGNVQLHFDNLFGGKNKALSETTNEFINQNWKVILDELKPLLAETFGHILISVMKGFLELYAIEDLFPNS